MIPRLRLHRYTHRLGVTWPDAEPRRSLRDNSHELYDPRARFRKLRMMIDSELVSESADRIAPTKASVLCDLAQHDLVECYQYADEGPPTSVPTDGRKSVPGWVVVEEHEGHSGFDRAWSAVYEHGKYVSDSAVWGEAVTLPLHDVHSEAYADMAPDLAAERRGRDGLAIQVAEQGLEADLYVTERPYLHNPGFDFRRLTTVCGPETALPIVGLYLRAQGEYLIAHNYRLNKGLFFHVGARELIPSSWRWLEACARYDEQATAGVGGLADYGRSAVERIIRALQSRDEIHLALNARPDHDRHDDALRHLDIVLVFLMGALDVCARVAHVMVGLPPTDRELRQAGWQNTDKWLPSVRARCPDLAEVVSPGRRGHHALTVLRLLRNRVHAEGLQPVQVVKLGELNQVLVRLPAADHQTLLDAVDALGGQEPWGMRHDSAYLLADPGTLADRLLAEVAQLVEDLMRITPTDERPGVALEAGQDEASLPGYPWRQPARTSIRWQLGLD